MDLLNMPVPILGQRAPEVQAPRAPVELPDRLMANGVKVTGGCTDDGEPALVFQFLNGDATYPDMVLVLTIEQISTMGAFLKAPVGQAITMAEKRLVEISRIAEAEARAAAVAEEAPKLRGLMDAALGASPWIGEGPWTHTITPERPTEAELEELEAVDLAEMDEVAVEHIGTVPNAGIEP